MGACPHERGLAFRCAIIHTMECPALSAVADKLQQRQVPLVCSTGRAFQLIGNLAVPHMKQAMHHSALQGLSPDQTTSWRSNGMQLPTQCSCAI